MENRAEVEVRITRLMHWEKFQARLFAVGEEAKKAGRVTVEPSLMRNLAEYVEEVEGFVGSVEGWCRQSASRRLREGWLWVRNWLQLCDWIGSSKQYNDGIGESILTWGAIMPMVKLRQAVQKLTGEIQYEWVEQDHGQRKMRAKAGEKRS